MPIDKLSANAFATGAVANSLGYTPANLTGDNFTGNVVFSANATVTGAATFSNTVAIGGDYISPHTGFKNRIINGEFAISQRGTSFTPTDSAYGLDRWHFRLDGTPGTLAVTQAALAAAELPPFSYAMRFNQSVTASGRTYLRVGQYIEGLERFSGRQVVVSFYAKCASGTVAIPTLRLDRYFGTGGSPSSADNMSFSSGGTPTITTTWTRYTAIGTVTSTSGKTYGTNNNSSLLVGIDFPTSGTFDVYVTGFQVEIGSVATLFEFRPISTELSLCQRYYQSLGNVGLSSYNATGVIGFVFPVTMRSTPTVSWSYNGTNNAIYRFADAAVSTLSSPTVLATSTGIQTFYAFSPTSWAGASGYGYQAAFVLSAEL